jgi:hypothetical protein
MPLKFSVLVLLSLLIQSCENVENIDFGEYYFLYSDSERVFLQKKRITELFDTTYSHELVIIDKSSGFKSTFHNTNFYHIYDSREDSIFCNIVLDGRFMQDPNPPLEIEEKGDMVFVIQPLYRNNMWNEFDSFKIYPDSNRIDFYDSDTVVYSNQIEDLYYTQTDPIIFQFYRDEMSLFSRNKFDWHYFYKNLRSYIEKEKSK